MKKWIPVSALIILLIAFYSPNVLAGTQDFVLVNETGVDLHELYISPSGTEDWGEDLLGDDILEAGASIEINFEGTDEAYWDIMVVDGEGNNVVWEEINLEEISVLTLYFDGKKVWAEWE